MHQLGPVYTIDHEVGPWEMAFFRGPTSMVRFLKKQFCKAFGPLTRCKPSVDHAPKSECVEFFYIYAQEGQFSKKKLKELKNSILKKSKFDHSIVFSCFHLLSSHKKTLKTYHNNIPL